MVGEQRVLLEYDFDGEHLRTLRVLQMSLAGVSLVASGFVVVSFAHFRRLRSNFGYEQVANMALADVGSSVSFFLGAPRDRSGLCFFQAFAGQYFQLCSVLWATAIATTLFAAITRRESVDVQKWRPHVYACCYGVPLLFASLPFSTASYGSAGAWCWIRRKPRQESNAWRFSAFYVPCWLCILYNARVYGACASMLRRLSTVVDDAAAAKLRRTVRRLVRYPAILVLCWIAPTANRLQQSLQRRPIFALYVVAAVSLSLTGFLNALAFGATDQVTAEWAAYFGTRKGHRVLDGPNPSSSSEATKANARANDDDDKTSHATYDDNTSHGTYDDKTSHATYDDKTSHATYDDKKSLGTYDDKKSLGTAPTIIEMSPPSLGQHTMRDTDLQLQPGFDQVDL